MQNRMCLISTCWWNPTLSGGARASADPVLSPLSGRIGRRSGKTPALKATADSRAIAESKMAAKAGRPGGTKAHESTRHHSDLAGGSRGPAEPGGAPRVDAALRCPPPRAPRALDGNRPRERYLGVARARRSVAAARDVRARRRARAPLLPPARVHALHRVPHPPPQRRGGGRVRHRHHAPAPFLPLRALRPPHLDPSRGPGPGAHPPPEVAVGLPRVPFVGSLLVGEGQGDSRATPSVA